MSKSRKPTSDASEILHRRYFAGKPKMLKLLEEEHINADIADKVYDLRSQAGLSQRSLAKLVKTTASVICRLEDSEYQGHSIGMLRRIAAALNNRLEIKFVPIKQPPKRILSRPI